MKPKQPKFVVKPPSPSPGLNSGGYGKAKAKAYVPAQCQRCKATAPESGFAPIFDEVGEQKGQLWPVLLCNDCWYNY